MLFPTAFARMEAGMDRHTGAIIAAGVLLLLFGAAFFAFW
jgi:hypothetical protein